MKYFDFLSKRVVSDELKNKYVVSNDEESGVSSTSKGDKRSIFTDATHEDLAKVDYTKVVDKPEEYMEELPEDKELTPLEYALKTIFSFEAVKGLADTDGDGSVSAEEAEEFVKTLAEKDGNGILLSQEDFDILLNELGIDLDVINEFLELNDEVSEQSSEPVAQSPSSEPPATVNAPSSSQPVQPSNSVSRASDAPTQPKTLENMSLQELQSEKSTRMSTLNDKRTALNAVHNGSNEKVKCAKTQVDKARKEYEDALKSDPAAKKFADKILKNNKNIEKNQVALDKNASEISNKESEISDLSAELSSSKNTLSMLEGTLSSLPAPTGKEEDKAKDKRINAQKSKIQSEISSTRKQIKSTEKKLEKLQKQLEKLNKDKAELEEEKKTLLAEKASLDDQVKKTCSEDTKGKLEAFNKATSNLENVKSKELSIAQKAVDEAKKAVDEVNKKITEAERSAAENLKFLGSDVVSNAVELALSQVGVRENGRSNDSVEVRKYKNGRKDNNPWCASFASWLYGAGQNRSNSETFGYTASSQEIKRKAQAKGCYASINSNYTPEMGDLAMWSNGDGTGHVGIVVATYADGSFDTVEGNSSNAVSRRHYKSKHSVGRNFNGFVQMSKWEQYA